MQRMTVGACSSGGERFDYWDDKTARTNSKNWSANDPPAGDCRRRVAPSFGRGHTA